MRNWVWKIGMAAMGGILAACSSSGGEDPVAGSSMETENSIALCVFAQNGTPAARVKVFVRPENYLSGESGPLADSVMNSQMNFETNDSGVVSLDELAVGQYVIEARDESLRGAVKFERENADSSQLVSLNMEKPGSVSGRVQLPDGINSATVGVQGLEYSVKTDSLGRFTIDELPAGNFDVVAYLRIDSNFVNEYGVEEHLERTLTFGSAPTMVVSGKSDKVAIGDTILHFMFDDFEKGVDAWELSHSEYASGTLDADSAGKGRKGSVAHFICQNDSNLNWVLIGANLGGPVDMSKLDSVVLWVRGVPRTDSTKLFFNFAFDVVADSVDAFESGKAWQSYELTSPSEWNRFVVIPSELMESDSANTGGNVGWDSVKTHVNKFSIFGGVGGEYWIDDIEVFGMDKFVAKKQD